MNDIALDDSINNSKPTATDIPSIKLYSRFWIGLGTFLGGPLPGFYFLSKNYAACGNQDSAKRIFWIGIMVTLLLCISLAILPDSILKHIPHAAIPAVYTAIIDTYFRQYQEPLLKEHIKNKGKKQSGWKALAISLLLLATTLLCFLAVSLLIELLGFKI